MPVTLRIDPTANSQQAVIVPNATPRNDGVMTAAQAAELAAIVAGTVSSVSGTAPIVSTGGLNPDISITPATPMTAGSMSAANKSKLDGLTQGVTSIAAGTGIQCTPSPIVATGTVALANTAVTPGSFTNINGTVDAQGRLTAAANGKLGSYYWSAAKTWAQVWAEVVAGGGYGTIYVDNTTGTLTITAAQGPYDFTAIQFVGYNLVGPGAVTTIDFESGALIDAGAYVALRVHGPSLRFRPLAALMTPSANKRVVLEISGGATFGNSALDATIFTTSFTGFGGCSMVINGRLVTSGNVVNPLFSFTAVGSLRIFYEGLGPNNTGYDAFSGRVAGGPGAASVLYYGTPFTFGLFKAASVVAPATAAAQTPNAFFLPTYTAAQSAANAENKGEGFWNTTSANAQMSDGTSYLDIQMLSQSAVKTAGYAARKNEIVRCNPTGGAFAVTLPAATGHKCTVVVKNQSNSTTAITISPTGGDTIDGASSGTINTSRGSMTYISDGTSDWMLISST